MILDFEFEIKSSSDLVLAVGTAADASAADAINLYRLSR